MQRPGAFGVVQLHGEQREAQPMFLRDSVDTVIFPCAHQEYAWFEVMWLVSRRSRAQSCANGDRNLVAVARDERHQFSESEDCVFSDFERVAFINACDNGSDMHIIA
eukprot:Amastigsp_a342188_3.p2 type:complete len:107 gc:universal Amastigsp_a342188_3:494-174(-)